MVLSVSTLSITKRNHPYCTYRNDGKLNQYIWSKWSKTFDLPNHHSKIPIKVFWAGLQYFKNNSEYDKAVFLCPDMHTTLTTMLDSYIVIFLLYSSLPLNHKPVLTSLENPSVNYLPINMSTQLYTNINNYPLKKMNQQLSKYDI